MNIEINILNVDDADAIIVELFNDTKSLVMVIDGGRKSDYQTKMKPNLEKVLLKHNKPAPEIVVCTHYDEDHIAGLIPLVRDYINDIQEVWVHKCNLLSSFVVKANKILNERNKTFEKFDVFIFERMFDNYNNNIPILKENAGLVLESISSLQKLIDLIPKGKLKEVFHGYKLTNWEEITVFGPTQAYFDSLFPSTKSFDDFIKEESEEKLKLLTESKKNINGLNPCDLLKTDTQATTSKTNKASIIIAIDVDKKRFLFTGDAGIESFKNIPNWKDELKDLYFLKIPHHGSNYNMTKEMAELMKPVYAYCSGNNHQVDEVIECLRSKTRNVEVKTTKDGNDLSFKL